MEEQGINCLEYQTKKYVCVFCGLEFNSWEDFYDHMEWD